MILNDRIKLLDDHQLLYFRGKVTDQLLRQRIRHAELQDAHGIPEDFLDILIRSGSRDDAELCAAHFHAVHGRCLGIFRKLRRSFFHERMSFDGVAGHHDILCDILFIGLYRNIPFPGLDDRLGMRHAGAHLDHDRRIELFGKFIGKLCKFQRFFGIRRLQHGHLRGDRVMTGILFILGGMHPCIIRHADHESGIHARIGHGVKRIRRHIQADMLLCTESSFSGQAGPESRLHGHLLVRCPFAVDLIVLCRFLCYLRTRCARIAGNETYAGFKKAARDSFIPEHDLFRHL